jgi:colanic acid/amylovoran biosynthesis glycosyltransferase
MTAQPAAEPGRTVVVWRSVLLLPSETFVRAQADALTRWRAAFLGALKVDSPLSRDTDAIAFPGPGGRRSFLRLRLTGGSPALRRVLAAQRPDLVHAHFGGDGWLVSRTAEQAAVPLVVTLHGHDVTRQPKAPGVKGIRYRRNLRTVFRRATLIIAVSEHIRRAAIALGADPAKVRVHHTGVALHPAPSQAAPKQWDVLFVGRFVEKKGLDDLVEALATVDLPATPRALFIGSGPLKGAIRTRAAQLGVDATFLGHQEPDAVRAAMTSARLFASPSKTAADGDSEGLPTTILEAASLGVPAVSTYHSGVPEAVLHEETGLLADEGDRQALAKNIARLLADDALRAAMGAAARRHVEENFDLHRQTRRLEDLYDEAVAQAEQARSASAS